MDMAAYKKILEKIIPLCDDIAFGRKVSSEELYAYTIQKNSPIEVARLAEAFGLMLVKLDIREEHTHRLIAELTTKNAELEAIKTEIEAQNANLLGIVQSGNTAKTIIGQSDAIKEAVKFAKAVARRPVHTMLLGETGTGKEKFAKFIHFSSNRCNKPFVAVNCSALPDALFESEMFGIEKGVATGVNAKKGLFEEANGGTLFLDEIGDMPLNHQAKLLRAIEEQEVMRVGSSKPIPIDVKIISATNMNIEKNVQEKKFRMDLYYRLNVAEIHIPPLRERGEDIVLLATQFLQNHCAQMKQQRLILLPRAREALMQYSWPGNVRELNNEMERAVVLALDEKINVQSLSKKIIDCCNIKQLEPKPQALEITECQAANVDDDLTQTLNLYEIERACILKALDKTNGNRTKTANLLGITREGLRKKLLRMNID